MKKHSISAITSAILILLAATLACSTGATPEPTATPTSIPPTDTPAPTATKTEVPTSTRTPRPTATLTPTPAPVGVPVKGDDFEVTVLKARTLASGVYTGDGYYWTTNPGYLFIELGVKVSRLKHDGTVSVPWQYIYVIEDTGDAWYPSWGGFKAVEAQKELDPATISVSSIKSGDDLVVFEENLYLRLIYIVSEKQPTVVHFIFDETPMIKIVVNE